MKNKLLIRLLFFTLAALAVVAVCLSFGSVRIPVTEIFGILFLNKGDEAARQILFQVRLPRVMLAMAVGGGLSVAGAVFQSLLKNPLAEPYILGISSGSAFGAVLAITLGAGFWLMQLLSFSGAISVMILVYILSMRFYEIDPNTMLLSGVMIGAFFSAAILVLVSFLNESLKTAVFWLMGNLSSASPANSYPVLIISILFSGLLSVNSQKYNVLAMGDENAMHLGVNTAFLKNYTYIMASILISVLVSVSGIIGFVGLLIPHLCRMIFGADNRVVVPGSFFLGAIFLTVCDTVARAAIPPSEIPVGAVTAFFGAPLFVYLLRKRKS